MLPSPEPGEGRDVHEQPHVTHCRCHHSSTNAVTKALSCADCTFSLSVVRPICSLVPLSHPTPWNVNNNQYIPPLLLCYVHFSKGCPEIVLFLARSSWNEQDFHKPCTQWVGANCIQPADHLLAHVNCLFFFLPSQVLVCCHTSQTKTLSSCHTPPRAQMNIQEETHVLAFELSSYLEFPSFPSLNTTSALSIYVITIS